MVSRTRLLPGWFSHSRLKIRHLQLLAALHRQKRLHLAADGLGISQPAASRLLVELEDGLGQPLFSRQGRTLEPTPFGEILTRRALAILSELDGARDEMNALGDGHLGRVAVGAVDGPMVELLAGIAARALEDHPRLEIALHGGSSTTLLDGLLGGHLDMVLGRPVPPFDPKLLSYAERGREDFALVARAGHPLQAQLSRHKRRFGLAELREARWVLQPRGSILRDTVDAMFLAAGTAPPDRMLSTDSFAATLSLLRETDAVSVLSEPLARQQAEYGQLTILPLDPAPSAGPYGLILPVGRSPSPAARTVLALLDAAVPPPGRTGP
ncbi:LysR substrate-binding domain-containing protein [Rhizosaccharibacter radicis]|uniref:LysR substrate-binding domain-containing protein n=1 Tax=Rhizosaccharibacter radicis TaxID=2782605 RepID=A0ABT1VVV1_9PROT|nr:LysR substrate-binding domain-containing protein [Acetobacteraceae bacterium KSS12]